MLFKLNKRGLGLPTVLGIVTFVIAIVASLMTYAVFQAQLVAKSFERTEAYANAVQVVDATAKIIARDRDLSRVYLDALETEMGVTITPFNASVYTITAMVTSTKSVTSYLSGSSSSSVSTFSSLFDYMGTESNFYTEIFDPLITPIALLSTFLPTFISTTFPSITPQTEFTDFQSIVDYVFALTQSSGSYSVEPATILTSQSTTTQTVYGHWYIEGDLNIQTGKNLLIPEGYLLVVTGNLNLPKNSQVVGNMIINGNLNCSTAKGSTANIRGTFYVGGNATTSLTNSFGIQTQPLFMLAEGTITLGNNSTGYAYFLCNKITGNNKNIVITGGIYAVLPSNINKVVITDNISLDENSPFYDYALPASIPSSSGGTSFIFTSPKMN